MLKASYFPYILNFKVPSGTSRGILTEKPSWVLKLWDTENESIVGIGEVSIIPGLSVESNSEVISQLEEIVKDPQKFADSQNQKLAKVPSVRFGFETALFDLQKGGTHILFPSGFTLGRKGIRTNGLIWMDKKEEMLQSIQNKISQGYGCLKLKVGAIAFDDEMELLRIIRNSYPPDILEIRLDANGAFNVGEALQKLEQLSKFGIHSIEQPIKQGQWEAMSEVCRYSPIPVALDEELIGIFKPSEKKELLDFVKPPFIILKPSLVGGLHETHHWKLLAEQRNIGWWVTSALEGNIGLNAIAQWTFIHGTSMPQGLGTGQIYSNNFSSPLEMEGEQLFYNPEKDWVKFSTHLQNQLTGNKKPISPENKDNPQNHLPLEGVGGWNKSPESFQTILLNNTKYRLSQIHWNEFRNINPEASWWQSIVDFLQKWMDPKPTIALKTSGSTGTPKIIEVKKKYMVVSAIKTCRFFHLNPTSTALLCLPTEYIAGQMMLVRAMVSGMNLLCVKPEANPLKELDNLVDFAAMVPYQVNECLLFPHKLALIKNLIIGGGKVPQTMIKPLTEIPVEAFETFGMTETLSHIALRKISPVTEPYFKTLEGITVFHENEGQLCVHYPELNIHSLETNDMVHIIDSHTFQWLGRKDFIINSGGIKISPELIEESLSSIISKPYCIIGLPDDLLGEKLVLVIEGKIKNIASINKKIAVVLPKYHQPKEIRFIHKFPVSATGKILRYELKRQINN